MSKIFISTTLNKAEDCFSINTENDERTRLKDLGIADSDNPISQYGNQDIYFHYDESNPTIDVDGYNDYLLKHNQSNPDFASKFSKFEHCNHTRVDSSKFRLVYKILLDDNVQDKYNTIKSIVFPVINAQVAGQIGNKFLNGGIEIDQIKNLLGDKFTNEIEEIINLNIEYHKKKKANANTKIDDDQNVSNFYKLKKAMDNANR